MNLYRLNKENLANIKETPFKLEKEIQKLFEKNLAQTLNLELVKSEFQIKDKRIDTLAFDEESNAFIIIEYKRGKNYSVVDQGFTYLQLMLDNEADLVLCYNETLNKKLRKKDVEWSQTRVIFVSPSFTDDQKQASNFKDMAIELYEIKRYESNIIAINPIKKSKVAPSIGTITGKDSRLGETTKVIKVYTEEDHLENKSDSTKELYDTVKNAILILDDGIEIVPRRYYIAFKKNANNITYICIQKTALKIYINLKKGLLDDSKKITRDVSKTGHWGNGDYEVSIEDTADLEYIMSLIKQAI